MGLINFTKLASVCLPLVQGQKIIKGKVNLCFKFHKAIICLTSYTFDTSFKLFLFLFTDEADLNSYNSNQSDNDDQSSMQSIQSLNSDGGVCVIGKSLIINQATSA